MGKWYLRKIEIGDVLVACLVAGGLAATLSWLIFAWVGAGAEKFPWGSLGDWLAAIGTWVIGYGAWKYAREAHLLRQSELERAARRDHHMHAGRVQALREWAKIVRRPFRVTVDFEKASEGGLLVGTVKGAAKGAVELLKLVPLDDEAWRYLDKRDVELKVKLATFLLLFESQATTVLERTKKSDPKAPIDTASNSLWPEARETLADLDAIGIKLEEAAERIPEI